MAEREIACVVWHQAGHRIEVIYVEGKPDHLFGSEAVASELARDTGLQLILTPDDTRRWGVRESDTWHDDTPGSAE